MYKRASQLQQARLRRPVGDLLPSYFDNMTDEQKRDCLKQALFAVKEEILKETDKWRRKELGRQQQELQDKMRAIRPKRRCPGAEHYFIEATKQICGLATYSLIMGRAVELHEKAKKESA